MEMIDALDEINYLSYNDLVPHVGAHLSVNVSHQPIYKHNKYIHGVKSEP